MNAQPIKDELAAPVRRPALRCDYCKRRIWGDYYTGKFGTHCTVNCYSKAMGKK